VREPLINQMRLLLSETPKVPTIGELEMFLAENAERYMIPVKVTLPQVYFNSMEDVGPGGDMGVLSESRAGTDASELGADIGDARMLRLDSQYQFAVYRGGRLAAAVMALGEGESSRPLESVRGVHFARMTDRTPSSRPEFDRVESYLRYDWEMERRRGDLDRKMEMIRQPYRIVVEDVGGGEGDS
jgi:hypothetical protein